MRSPSSLALATFAVLLSLPACSDDEAPPPPKLTFVEPNEGDEFLSHDRTRVSSRLCVDGHAKPTHRLLLRNPSFERITFTTAAAANEVIVRPEGGIVEPGENIELSMELTPFSPQDGTRRVTVRRPDGADGEEMLEIRLEVTVDARLLRVEPVGWADEDTFVVAITNPTGFRAVELDFEHEDGSWSEAAHEIGPGETRRVIVLGKDGKRPPLGSRIALRSRCSESPLPDTHFFVRVPEE